MDHPTLMTTSLPLSRSAALCTCAIDAVASGTSSTDENTLPNDLPRSFSMIALEHLIVLVSCRREQQTGDAVGVSLRLLGPLAHR